MKKNYFFTLVVALIVSTFSYGQVLVADGFSYADGNLAPNGGWTAFSGAGSSPIQVVSGEAVITHGSGSREDTEVSFTASGEVYAAFNISVDDPGADIAGSDFEYFALFNGSAFKARVDIVAPNTAGGNYTIGISSNGSTAEATWASDLTFGQSYRIVVKFDQTTGGSQLWVNPTTSSDTSISGTDSGAAAVSSFALRQSNSTTDETIRVDDLMVGKTFNDVVTFVAPTSPSISLSSPADGTTFNPGTTSVDVTWSTSNTTSETVDIIVNGSRTSGVSSPFSVTTTDGQSYSISLELLDGANVTDTATTNFSVGSLSQVANIGALRAETEGNNFQITGGVIVTFVTGNSRNQIYIQDTTGGMLIDDPSGIITTSYSVGDEITGLKGELGSFQTVLQFKPTEDAGAATATGQSFSTTTVTMAQYIADAAKTANQREYESEWIKIDNATFADAGGTFAASTNYNITEGSDTMVMRVNFPNIDIIGTTIPSGTTNITGLAGQYGGDPQIYPTKLANIILGVESLDNIQGFVAFPNPIENKELTIRSASSDTKKVTLYSLLGRKVFSEKFNGTQKLIDVSSVNTGIYILKVVENGKISTRKLVIK